MLDVQSLERRWLRYKVKAYLPSIFIITLGVLGYGIYTLFFSIHPVTPKVKQPSFKSSSKPLVTKPSSENRDVVLEPSMDFMQTIDPVSTSTSIIPNSISTVHNELSKEPKTPMQSPLPKETVIQPPLGVKESLSNKTLMNDKKTNTPVVKRDDAPLNINVLEERFQSSPNPNLGLFIARYHYDHANYTEAYNYALKTNTINNKMEESWIIFAKSLIKMGKIDQAKKTLQQYFSQSNSENAKNLLDSLEKDMKK